MGTFADGLSALRPQAAAAAAGRIFRSELDRLAHDGAGFSFESGSNFERIYRQFADLSEVYDNPGMDPQSLERGQ